MHPFPIDPAKLSKILFEGSDSEDDAASDHEEWDWPTKAVPKHISVPDVPGTDAGHTSLPISPMPSWRPGPQPAPGPVPTPGAVMSLTEKAAIRKMHGLGKSLPDFSIPPHLEHVDWDLWTDEGRAMGIKSWHTQLNTLRLKITAAANALPSLRFSDSFMTSGFGPVCIVREFPSRDSRDDKRIQLYEVMPQDLADII